ncbi:hypothetical protein CROQUDRAFT_91581 [Cronartium quercuum f. sp. fusiforme G11]|uniref:Uncharacterized protein n=1 Tax=Cronartium quercuum f. sp. fusiforme G11 TaxID=708437 RepID=A0A9P6NNI7_9BASI|nr:hypothetical protein CROQUDRAFT_91581 [Cronartium quercuum f. sp. fusiforme G11]
MVSTVDLIWISQVLASSGSPASVAPLNNWILALPTQSLTPFLSSNPNFPTAFGSHPFQSSTPFSQDTMSKVEDGNSNINIVAIWCSELDNFNLW